MKLPPFFVLASANIISFDYDQTEDLNEQVISLRAKRSTLEDLYNTTTDHSLGSPVPVKSLRSGGQMGPGAQMGDDFVMRYVGTEWKPIDMIESMLDYFLTVMNSNLSVDDLLNYGCWCQVGK